MRIAQRLYEGIDIGGETTGLITYMRTDGVQIDPSAITQARKVIGEDYGNAYVPDAPRQYQTKAKNAQEAHEAIRPTDLSRRPADMHRLGDVVDVRLVEAAPVAGALRFELLSEGQIVPRGRKRDGKRDVLKSQRAEKERSHRAAGGKERKRGKQKSGKSGKGKSWRR